MKKKHRRKHHHRKAKCDPRGTSGEGHVKEGQDEEKAPEASPPP